MKKRKKRRTLKLLLLAVCVALVCYGSVKKDPLSVTEYSVGIDSLPESFEGFKIVQVSDLHGEDLLQELPELVRAQSPDIIAVTGDIISDAEDIPVAKALIDELVKISDVYFISGNHDFSSEGSAALEGVLADAGVRYLKNEYLPLERGGDRIILAGVEDPNRWADSISPDRFAEELRADYPDDCVVLLAHRNYWVTEYPELPVELILCGHEHGGIIRIPGVGGLIGHGKTLLPEYCEGEFKSGDYTMIVSRGIGNSVPLPRLNNPPELVSVTLNTAKGA